MSPYLEALKYTSKYHLPDAIAWVAFAPLSLLVELAVDVKLPSDKDTLLPYLFNRFKVGKLFVGESRTLSSGPKLFAVKSFGVPVLPLV